MASAAFKKVNRETGFCRSGSSIVVILRFVRSLDAEKPALISGLAERLKGFIIPLFQELERRLAEGDGNLDLENVPKGSKLEVCDDS